MSRGWHAESLRAVVWCGAVHHGAVQCGTAQCEVSSELWKPTLLLDSTTLHVTTLPTLVIDKRRAKAVELRVP